MPSSLVDGRRLPLELFLAGQRVLIVEDVFLLADASKGFVESAGGAVVGPYGCAKVAFNASVDRAPTLALLDLGLGGEPCFQLADALASLGVPVVFLTGYPREIMPSRHAGSAWLQKPSSGAAIVDALAGSAR